jgi:hypothetical protein
MCEHLSKIDVFNAMLCQNKLERLSSVNIFSKIYSLLVTLAKNKYPVLLSNNRLVCLCVVATKATAYSLKDVKTFKASVQVDIYQSPRYLDYL